MKEQSVARVSDKLWSEVVIERQKVGHRKCPVQEDSKIFKKSKMIWWDMHADKMQHINVNTSIQYVGRPT